MVNNIKAILSVLKVAQKMNKKEVEVVKTRVNKLSLDLLWKEGFIYGYCLLNFSFYRVFVKYSTKGFSVLQNAVFLNKLVKKKFLYSINKLDSNRNYFICNSSGFFSHKKALKKGVGGKFFIKI